MEHSYNHLEYLPNTINLLSDTFSPETGYGMIDAVGAVEAATETTITADSSYSGDNLDAINADQVHANGYTGNGVTIAIIDSGVDIDHEAFIGRIWSNPNEIADNGIDDDGNGIVDDVHGADITTGNGDVSTSDPHGTHVAGIASAVAPDAKIMPIKVESADGTISSTDIAKGLYYAADNGANVVNISLGSNIADPEIEAAIRYAESKGITVVMAAGNDGGSSPIFPAHIASEVGIAVGASDNYGAIADFSNRAGDTPLDYVLAPGVQIRSSIPDNGYADYDGTSMASPHVAGLAALIQSANPNLTPAEIEEIIANTAIA